ncbi:MAG: hypothetical protein MI725_17260 [Pirellulales bacterium]|nr:hypothetical protein [Pirellulales bacterium]
MKYAFCNEMYGDVPFEEAWAAARALGYTGVEIAPFTLLPGEETANVNDISPARRQEVKQLAAKMGLEVVGLHWLLAKTRELYLTAPSPRSDGGRPSICARWRSCAPTWVDR